MELISCSVEYLQIMIEESELTESVFRRERVNLEGIRFIITNYPNMILHTRRVINQT